MKLSESYIFENEHLSIRRQCDLLSFHRSAFYYQPVEEGERNSEIMGLIEERFPNVGSLSYFIDNTAYLGRLEITFNGSKTRLADISNNDYLLATQGLLQNIESEIKSNLTGFEGLDYIKE